MAIEWSPWTPLTYTPATVAATSPAPCTQNPTPAASPGPGQRFLWDSAADFPTSGFVRVRITVADGHSQLSCETSFEVVN